MKTVIEFGRRRPYGTFGILPFSENTVLSSIKEGKQLFIRMAGIFAGKHLYYHPEWLPLQDVFRDCFGMGRYKDVRRIIWKNNEFFVVVTLLDDEVTGPAYTHLLELEEGEDNPSIGTFRFEKRKAKN